MKKLKAFTLIELIVALILSGICLNISILCYEIIGKQFNSFKNDTEQSLELSQVNIILNNDISEAKFVTKTEHGISVIGPNGKFREYKFSENSIIISNFVKSDTFLLKKNKVDQKYMGIQQLNEGNLIDELIINFQCNNEDYLFHLFKTYSASDKIENELKNQKD